MYLPGNFLNNFYSWMIHYLLFSNYYKKCIQFEITVFSSLLPPICVCVLANLLPHEFPWFSECNTPSLSANLKSFSASEEWISVISLLIFWVLYISVQLSCMRLRETANLLLPLWKGHSSVRDTAIYTEAQAKNLASSLIPSLSSLPPYLVYFCLLLILFPQCLSNLQTLLQRSSLNADSHSWILLYN